MVKVGIAARKRESKQRTCAIVSLVFSFLSIALLFAGAYVHDLNLGTQQAGAAVFALFFACGTAAFLACVALIVGVE